MNVLLAYAAGWGWWWWWVAIAILIWLLFIPPFGYGNRWYTTYRDRYGRTIVADETGMPVATSSATRGTVPPTNWHLIEERFVHSPSAGAVEADHTVHSMMPATPPADVAAEYQAAHEIVLRDAQGQASTDDLHTAMRRFAALYQRLA